MNLQLYTQIVTMTFHVLWCELFINRWQMGYKGAAFAINITYIANMVILDFMSSVNVQLKKSFKLIPDESVFTRLLIYLELGLPAAMMSSFEWWIFEILAIMAGLISVEALAAEVIIVNFVTFMFMIPLGCSFAASAFTGFFCASGKIKEAKKYTRLTVAFGEVITLLALGLMFAF